MRRALLVLGIFAMVGCGISAVATRDNAVSGDTPDTGSGANIPDTSAPPADGTTEPDAALDAGDGRPDAGVLFVPSHIGAGDYTLPVTPTTISMKTVIDTSKLTVDLGAGPITGALTKAAASPDAIAVWSVGPLVMNDDIDVIGTRALVIVVNGDVMLGGHTIGAAASQSDVAMPTAGPGGAPAAVGGGAGGAGQTNGPKQSGGGGAGHAIAGAVGGKADPSLAGAAGKIDNLSGALLVGGSGGGNGGGFVNTSTCAKGGGGGGALQISAVGQITFTGGTLIDVSGGGGMGGCTGAKPSAGGGGGAGGLVYLEAVAGIAMPFGATILASGGAGGEGGDTNGKNGKNGETPTFAFQHAFGGSGDTGGGNGGNGGVGPLFLDPAIDPTAGDNSDVAGGGGAAFGSVFFRVRAPATFTGGGAVIAQSTNEPF